MRLSSEFLSCTFSGRQCNSKIYFSRCICRCEKVSGRLMCSSNANIQMILFCKTHDCANAIHLSQKHISCLIYCAMCFDLETCFYQWIVTCLYLSLFLYNYAGHKAVCSLILYHLPQRLILPFEIMCKNFFNFACHRNVEITSYITGNFHIPMASKEKKNLHMISNGRINLCGK